MKKINLLFLVLFASISASAQYNYYKFSAGAGLGITQYFGDVAENPIKKAITTSLDYNINPFVSAGIEYQFGSITGGDSVNNAHKRYFLNKYSAIIANGRIQLGQVVDADQGTVLYALRGVYLGTGIGFISNKMDPVVRVQPGTGYVFPGEDKSSNLLIPANIGINFDIPDQWGFTRYKVGLNYQFNVTFGEGLDGYNDPPIKFKNNNPDMYGFASVSVKICFGPEGLY